MYQYRINVIDAFRRFCTEKTTQAVLSSRFPNKLYEINTKYVYQTQNTVQFTLERSLHKTSIVRRLKRYGDKASI